MLILVLDTSILRSAVLPALAAQHFADLDADVAVVSGAGGDDVVWSSRPGFPSGGDRGDVVTALLAGPPPFGGPRRGGGLRPFRGFGGSPAGRPGSPPGSGESPHGEPRETPPGSFRDLAGPASGATAGRHGAPCRVAALGARRARRGGWSWRITPVR